MTTRVDPLEGKQRVAVANCTGRINIFEGSVRSSKTICSLLAWIAFIRTGPAGNLVMVGKTERTLKRNVIDPLIDMLGPKRVRYSAGSGELWVLGRRIYVAGANDERAQDKIRGLTLAGAYVDEVTVIPESFWAMLLTRMSVDGALVYGTTNPDGPNHWLMRDYLKRACWWLRHDGTIAVDDTHDDLGLHRFSFRLEDNPALSADYVASQRAAFTGLWYLRFIEGQWVLAEGSIYDTFDPTPGGTHVVDHAAIPAAHLHHWTLAVDYGTTNPFVALLMAVGPGDDDIDRVWVVDEWRWDSSTQRRRLTDAEYSAELARWLPTAWRRLGVPARDLERVVVDPAAASFIVQLHRDGWERVRGGDNTVVDGIRNVASLLAADRLRISSSCAGLIEEKTGYVWDPKKTAKGEDAPLKQADHGPDAERYGVRSLRRWWRGRVLDGDGDEQADG